MRQIVHHEQKLLELEEAIARAQKNSAAEVEIQSLQDQLRLLQEEVYSTHDPESRIAICRHADRPRATQWLQALTTDWVELHGDRRYGDDPALIAGLGTLEGHRCLWLAQEKGSTTEERVRRRFGMCNPEGYRKAQRLLELAGRLQIPTITLIDTAGAYPGLEAEERGQGWAIAEMLAAMATHRAPLVAAIVGEGCSGGALALAVADRLLMLENTYFSVISPEGCASILWRDLAFRSRAAEALQIFPEHLFSRGIADVVVPEPRGGAHRNPAAAGASLRSALLEQLELLRPLSPDALVEARRRRYRLFDGLGSSPTS